MTDLATQIRALIDFDVAAISVEEVTLRPSKPRRRTRSRPALALVGALIGVLGVAAVSMFILASRESAKSRVETRPAHAGEPAPAECIRSNTNLGCERGIADAKRLTGISLRTPTFLPPGWELVRHIVRIGPAGFHGTPVEIRDYSQVWAPEPFDANGNVEAFVQIVQREAQPAIGGLAEGQGCPSASLHVLADGSTACGVVRPSGATLSGPSSADATIWWVKDDVYFYVHAVGLEPEVLFRVVNSIHE